MVEEKVVPKLTAIQKTLLDIGKKKGFLLFDDFVRFYASNVSQRNAIRRFVALKLIKESDKIPGRFEVLI